MMPRVIVPDSPNGCDRVHPLSDGEARRFGKRRGLQVRRIADLQQREVVSLSTPTTVALYFVLVGERDLDLLRVVDDVVVGQDMSLLARMKPEP